MTFPGASLDLTGVAPTILRHEGRLPLPPYIIVRACVQEGRTVSGPHYPDVLLILFLHGNSWILNYSFFQGEEPSRFPGLIWTGRAMPFPGGTAHKIHLARTKQTTHRREPHTLNTTRHTQAHTTGTGPPICTGLPAAWVSGAGS